MKLEKLLKMHGYDGKTIFRDTGINDKCSYIIVGSPKTGRESVLILDFYNIHSIDKDLLGWHYIYIGSKSGLEKVGLKAFPKHESHRIDVVEMTEAHQKRYEFLIDYIIKHKLKETLKKVG